MRYYGYFSSLKGDYFRIDINTQGEGEQELTLGATPFVTQMDVEGDTIYHPAKYTAATISFVADEYFFDMYQSTAHGASVNLYKILEEEETLEWTGYITPSLYNVGYTRHLEECSINAIDALSSLQYYKYTPMGANANVHNLINVVRHCVNKAGAYARIRLANSLKESAHNQPLWTSGYVSEQLFMGEDSEGTDGADTLTYKEVLEEICRFMGMTMYAEKDTVYIIDPDFKTEFWEVQVTTGFRSLISMEEKTYEITGDSYAEGGAKLSMDKVYSKVTVNADYRTFDSMLPELFEGSTNITVDDPDWFSKDIIECGEFVDVGGNSKVIAFDDKVPAQPIYPAPYFYTLCFIQFWKPKWYKCYNYATFGRIERELNSENMTQVGLNHGAYLAKVYTKGKAITNVAEPSIDDTTARNDITQINYDEYLFLVNHKDTHISDAEMLNYPFFRTYGQNQPAFFGGDKTYIVISGDIYFHEVDNHPFPIPDGIYDPDHGTTLRYQEQIKLRAKLQWGSIYWNGTEWTTTDSTFDIPYGKIESTGTRLDALMFKDLQINNTVTWRMGLDGTGYAIPMPSNGALAVGAPIFILYKPYSTKDSSGYNENYFTAIRNFKMEAKIGDPTFTNEQDTDTSYTNVINLEHIEELSPISLKLCTYDGKKANFNSVAVLYDGAFRFLDTCWHERLSDMEIADNVERYTGELTDGHQRQEEHIIYKLVNQYEKPMRVLEITLNECLDFSTLIHESNLNTDFLIMTREENPRYGTFTYQLIEKCVL